jgi:rhamnosyltransferase
MLLLRSLAERILRVSRGYERGSSVGEQPAVLLWCDEPNLQTTPRLSGITCIHGWAIARSKIGEVRIFLDDAELGRAFHGFVRDDVIQKHPGYGNDIHIGFAFRFDISKKPPGIHTLKILATAITGETASIEGKVELVPEQYQDNSPPAKRTQERIQTTISLSESQVVQARTNRNQEERVDISIVILARNEARNLSRLLPLLKEQKTSAKFEIIGIDTESEDGTADLFRRHRARVFSVPQKEFHHFHTRLMGVSQAYGPLVVFLVADAIPANQHWLQALVQPLLEDPLVAATYSRQLPAPRCVPWEARDIYRGGSVVREVKQVDWSQPISVENYAKHQWKFIAFSDVSSCYRKELLQSLPVPDGVSEMEDQYWCKCLLERGCRIVLDPTSIVVHSHNDSIKRLYHRQLIYGRCFSAFTDSRPEPWHSLVFRSLEDSAGDLFYIAATPDGSFFRKWWWMMQTPIMRFVKRYGFREGIRQGYLTRQSRHS